ncbi:UNVERIFIED_CONTAM: hypothetical protein FKN15_000256 [Acipenser sinensis]
MIAIINGWTDWEKTRRPCLVYKPSTEKAGQLATALEEEELQVLPGLGPDKMVNYDVLATVLKCSFGRVEPAVGLCQCLATRSRGSGEKQGILAGDVSYLVQRGYPEFLPTTEEDLTICPRPNPNCPAQVQVRRSSVALSINVDCTLKQFIPTWLSQTWAQSVETCRQRYMELPTMETEVENSNFWSNGRFYGWCWIGLQYNSSNINNTWEWVNGNPTTYSLWAEPPTGVGCGAFYSYSKAWYIRDCKLTLLTVCQAPYPVTGLTTDSVENNTVSLSWSSPSQLYAVPHYFIITYSNSNSDDEGSINTTSNSIVFSNLRPGRQYVFKVCTTENNTFPRSQPTSSSVYINPVPPGRIRIVSVGNDSVSLSWGRPSVTMQFSYSYNITYSCSFWDQQDSSNATSESTVVSNLRPGSEYVFNITTVQVNGVRSSPTSISLYTIPPPPGKILIDSVESNSVSLSWGSPFVIDGIPHSFNITYSCSFRGHSGSTSAPSNSTVISNLRLGCEYVFSITTVNKGGQSTPAVTSVYIKLALHGEIKIDSVGNDSVSLSWGSPAGMDGVQYSFNITYSCSFWGHNGSTSATSNSTVISNLRPGSKYVFNVTIVQADGVFSTPASISLYTNPAPPGEIALDSVETKLVSLSWATPIGMDDIPHSFNITYFSFYWDHYGSTTATSNSTTISNLRAGSEYVFNITTVQDNGGQSTPASIAIFTKPNEKRLYLKFVCSSTEESACEKEKQKVQQETEARLAKHLKGLYWKLNWKEKEVKECIDEPEEDV